MQRDDKHNANAVPLPPDEACNADPAHVHPDLEGGEGEVVNVACACQEEEPMWSRRPVLLRRLAKNKQTNFAPSCFLSRTNSAGVNLYQFCRRYGIAPHVRYAVAPRKNTDSLVNRTAAIGAHERQVFDKLLWGLVTSTIFVDC